MTVHVKQSAPCQRHMDISLGPDAIRPARERVLKEFQREATIAGFRKGKAPAQLVDRKYGEQIRDEVIRRLTREAFEQTAEEHKFRPVGPFEVMKLDFDQDKGLTLQAQVEVEPEFKLTDYRGIPAKQPALTVTPEERQLQRDHYRRLEQRELDRRTVVSLRGRRSS